MVPLTRSPADSQDTLLRRLLPLVGGWCGALGGPGVDAEEATHDVLLIVLDRLPGHPSEVPVEALAYAVTRRVLANHRRRAWFRRWLPGVSVERPGRSEPWVEIEARQTADRVAQLLERLPAEQREVLVLCDVEERTSEEVATLLGIPAGTVRSRLRLARARFRQLAPAFALAPPGPESDP